MQKGRLLGNLCMNMSGHEEEFEEVILSNFGHYFTGLHKTVLCERLCTAASGAQEQGQSAKES